ncbi:MAG TPA: ATP-binding cassette domain-containing protein, partial [Nitrolancea sp.]
LAAPSLGADTTLTTQAAIEVHDLAKTYPGNIQALKQLSFQVSSGTIYGLLGPNGAGKSTVIKILTTLTTPDSGRALVAGRDVVTQPYDVRRLIGCVAQIPATDPEASGLENLLLQGRLYGMSERDLRSRAHELLDALDLSNAAGRLVKTYSGGMKRKLDVAMGVIHRPRVLFLDEPTTGLDPEARAEMWQEIRRLTNVERVTILLTTHYLDEADHLADRIAIIDQGQLVAEGTPDQLKRELHGDTIQIELERDDETAMRRILTARDDVREVTIEGRVVRARVDNGATALPSIVSALESIGAGLVSVTVSRPSLDDVYFRYSGKSFAKAQEEGLR